MHLESGTALPFTYRYDSLLKKLTIPGLTTFPKEIFNFADEIAILDLSEGHLTTLPDDLNRLHHLHTIFLARNDFTEIPTAFATCRQLRIVGVKSCKLSRVDADSLPANLEVLVLTDNQITEILPSIGKLKNLRKLTVPGNQLSDLPHELLACTQLELIRLPANQFSEPPDWLFALPNLAWYADASNPGSVSSTAKPAYLDWADLDVGEKLGASAKNTVYAATIRRTNEKIAVKVFGGALSADGYPADEIAAYLAVGEHPALVRTIAEVTNAPEGKLALALAKIPPEYTDLGNPPTLQTVTRDTYPESKTFTINFILRVLSDISSALAHMHSKNLMHGDAYAHNILTNEVGASFLVDFGAASFYTRASDNRHELVEVKAFGRLMEDLMQRKNDLAGDIGAIASLQTLQAQCLSEHYPDRPAFTPIYATLQALRT